VADKTSGQILTMRYAEYLLDVDPEAALKLLQGIPCVDCGYTFDPTRRTPCSSYRSGLHRWDSRESRFPGDKIEEVEAPLTPGAGDPTQVAKDGQPGSPSDSQPAL